jgi:hypothetical protein
MIDGSREVIRLNCSKSHLMQAYFPMAWANIAQKAVEPMSIVKVLKDTARNIDVKHWGLTSADVQQDGRLPPWKIVKGVMEGGRQEGVDVIEIDSGAMKFTVVPTRGLCIWKGKVGEISLGWDSPVKEIVHPRFIDLSQRNGLGWLDGFGGWIVRCGLASVGPPCRDRGEVLTLHGCVDYLPADYVTVQYESSPVPRLMVSGTIEENHLPEVRLRLAAEISIEIGTATIMLDDIITNHSESTQEIQMLYHINFGPPLLGKGAELIAPIKRIAPRDLRAAEGSTDRWTVFDGPQGSDYTEQVYLMELQGDAHGNTVAMLRAPDRACATLLTFNVQELPHFVLWKNEADASAGYVTGLEPATSYPYPRPFEREGGRVPSLHSGNSRRTRVRVDVLSSRDSVQIEEKNIRRRVVSTPVFVPTPFTDD